MELTAIGRHCPVVLGMCIALTIGLLLRVYVTLTLKSVHCPNS